MRRGEVDKKQRNLEFRTEVRDRSFQRAGWQCFCRSRVLRNRSWRADKSSIISSNVMPPLSNIKNPTWLECRPKVLSVNVISSRWIETPRSQRSKSIIHKIRRERMSASIYRTIKFNSIELVGRIQISLLSEMKWKKRGIKTMVKPYNPVHSIISKPETYNDASENLTPPAMNDEFVFAAFNPY